MLERVSLGVGLASIEYQWIAPVKPLPSADVHSGASNPLVVFLHEGLGSLAQWKAFPQQLCERLGLRGLVYSRPGYGQSTPRAAQEVWGVDFMHQQAYCVLPALLSALKIRANNGANTAHQPLLLVGHSDGASIALLHAASYTADPATASAKTIAATVVLAPHLFVEDLAIASIQKANDAYHLPASPLRQGLAKYHPNPDSAFGGWAGAWLNPAFRQWNITAEAAQLRGPLLAIQGEEDEYGTLAQLDTLASCAPQCQRVVLAHCGHSPQRDHPGAVIEAIAQFLAAAGLLSGQ